MKNCELVTQHSRPKSFKTLQLPSALQRVLNRLSQLLQREELSRAGSCSYGAVANHTVHFDFMPPA